MEKQFPDNEENQRFILHELKNGNERAFEFIFNSYYSSLSRFSYSLIKDQDKAESFVQEVLIKLWEKHKSITNIENLLSYLMTMVRNQCIDYLRKEKANSKLYLKIRPDESVNTTEEQISRNEFEEKLMQSLYKLPERCRMAFEMSRFENTTNSEIALKMEISVKGVEALIGRSLKYLRSELHEFLPASTDKKQKRNSSILFFLFLNGFTRI